MSPRADLSDSFMPSEVISGLRLHTPTQQGFIVKYMPRKWRWRLAIQLFTIKKHWRSLIGRKHFSNSTYEGPTYALGILRETQRNEVQRRRQAEAAWRESKPGI